MISVVTHTLFVFITDSRMPSLFCICAFQLMYIIEANMLSDKQEKKNVLLDEEDKI